MATNEIKIYGALGLLLVLGGGVYLVSQQQSADNQKHVAGSSSAGLPELKLPNDDADKITKITVKPADKPEVTLEKQGDKWKVTKPVDYAANQANVKSLVDNLKELKPKDLIDPSPKAYPDFNLGDDKATHVVAYKGADKDVDLYFGKMGGRGQTVRKGGADGVYAVSGYSAYLYNRDVKNWRDTAILKFDDAAATRVDLKDESGDFAFVKGDSGWTGTLKGAPIDRFDENKVKDMLRTFKGLSADDFGDGKSDPETGLDNPSAHLTITLKDGDPIKLSIGKTSSGEARYARRDGDAQVYIISAWGAGWATAKPEKFQKAEDKKDGGAPAASVKAPMMGGMNPGMVPPKR